MPSSLLSWGLTVPWCITSEALDAMLSIAAREDVSPDALAAVMHGPKSLALRDGRRRDDSERTQMLGGVARIVIDGPIYRYADMFTKYSGGVTTESLARDFQTALDDPAVAAIALIIDSPGGEATGINELADTIYAARGKKPIGAYIEGYGASAAYWIASAADLVTVDESALVGSIGTVMGVLDPAKRVKYTIDFVSTQSPKKRVDPTTEEGAAYLQSLVDDMTEVFIAKVMRNRKMTRQQVLEVEGGMRIGQHAVSAGLANRLGAEDQLIRDLAEQAADTARRAVSTYPSPARVPGISPLRMEDSMDWKAFWKGMFQSAAEVEGTLEAAQIEPRALAPGEGLTAAAVPNGSPITGSVAVLNAQTDPALKSRLDELESQLAEQQTQARQAAAASFADGAVRAHQAFPSERQALYDAYIQASADDAARPLDTPRVARIEALISSRVPHSLTDELLASNAGGVLESDTGPKPPTPERIAALEAMTPLGRATLARKQRPAT